MESQNNQNHTVLFLTSQERQDFDSSISNLVRDLTELSDFPDMQEIDEWLKKIIEYNVTKGGKKTRGLMTVAACKWFEEETGNGNSTSKLSHVVGWCVEMWQGFCLMADDIMDGSDLRRGQLCWHRHPEIGLSAINDAILLENSVYKLLRKYFEDQDYYVDLLHLFHETNYKTIYGQSLDTRTSIEKRVKLYTEKLYSSIVKYKTSFYSFVFPIQIAMTISGFAEPELMKQVEDVGLEIGHLFQVQDDFLDVFGDSRITGKIGTDIKEGKCSWLIVTALRLASERNRKFLVENYGADDPERAKEIVDLYMDLKLPQIYSIYQDEKYKLIKSRIEKMSENLPQNLFFNILESIYKRQK